MKIFGNLRSGEFGNLGEFRNFRKLSGFTTQRTRQQHWTTRRLGQQSKNSAAPKSPRTQGAAATILSKEQDLQNVIFSLENI